MNKLKITLNEDGSVFQYTPDFKIMRGSYQNVLINIEVPHSLLIDPVNDTNENKTKTGNNVRVGGIITTATGKHLQTKRYEFQRVKDFVREGTAYRLYQRKMPKEFTMWDTLDEREEAQNGSLLLVINVINWLINDLNAKVEEISASPSFRLDIHPSAFLQEAEEIEEPSDFDLLQSQVQDHDKEIDDLKKDLYGEGDETLGEFLTSRLKAGWKIILKKDNGQIKIAVDVIKGKEIPIDTVSDLPAQNVQKAIEEIWKRVDFEFVDSLTGEDDYLVDNTDPNNPVIKHDKSKIDKASISDNLTTDDATKVLAASQGVVLKAEIEKTNKNVADEIDARTKADIALQDKISAEEATRKSEDATLKGLVDNLESVKASKTEMAEAIKTAIDAVINSAPAAFDTLKEIADWIQNDEEGTSALVLRIGEIEKKNQEQDQALADEISARETAESAINDSISTEISTREKADETLQENIDVEKTAREEAVETLTKSKLDDVQIEGGTNNGTIKVTKKIEGTSTTTDNISVTGLGSAAFTDSTEYATAAQGLKADKSINELEANALIRDALDEAKDEINNNITSVSKKVDMAVLFGENQELSEDQKAQARANIGAGASTFSGSYNDLGQKPVINTTNTESLDVNEAETVANTINLHKISKTGKLADALSDSEHQTISDEQKQQINTNKDNIIAVQSDIVSINEKISPQVTKNNPAMDRDFINSSISNMAAHYLTKDAENNPFLTYAELAGAETFYYAGEPFVPTEHDYVTVLSDESQSPDELGNYPTTRYTYQGNTWALMFIVNATAFTAAQLKALNSGITEDNLTEMQEENTRQDTQISQLINDIISKTAVDDQTMQGDLLVTKTIDKEGLIKEAARVLAVSSNSISDTDINTIIKSGVYGISSTCSNIPIKQSGVLSVIQYRGDYWAQQTYVTNPNEGKIRIFRRGVLDNETSKWSDWIEVSIEDPMIQLRTLICGPSDLVCLAKVHVYDTNVTISLSSTTNVTYNGTLVIATQNNDVRKADVYGDPTGYLAQNIFYNTPSQSNNLLEIYFKPAGYSKNVVDLKVVAPAGGLIPTDVNTIVSAIPDSASNHPTNLSDLFATNENLQKVINNTTLLQNSEGGFAAGQGAQNDSHLGAAIGKQASVDGSGGAIGYQAYTNDGGAIGSKANSLDGGGAVGYQASASHGGGAIGSEACVNNTGYGSGGAVGKQAKAGAGFSGGYQAAVALEKNSSNYIDAVQLGTGTNEKEKTLQVYDDNIYNADTHTLTVQNIESNTIKTLDAQNVKLTGEQTITGKKTFADLDVNGMLRTTMGGTKLLDVEAIEQSDLTKSSSGYIMYKSGIGIEWHVHDLTKNNDVVEGNFSISFAYLPTVVATKSGNRTSNYTPQSWPTAFTNVDKTSYKLIATDASNGYTMSIIAIGRWK